MEIPDGVCREYIVKSFTQPKLAQGEQETKPKYKEGENTSLRVVTRAQAKVVLEMGEPVLTKNIFPNQ